MKSPYRSIIELALIFLLHTGLFSCAELSPEPDSHAGLQKLAEGYALGSSTRVVLYSREELMTGYNAVFISLVDSASGKPVNAAEIILFPEMDMQDKRHSCPVRQPESQAVNGMFEGALMPAMPSGDMGRWTLNISVKNPENGLSGTTRLNISVKASDPSQVHHFVAEDGERYFVKYHFPEKVAVGVNPFELIVFKLQAGMYVPVEDLQVRINPQMPSMDHGAPNNIDPIHISGGHYAGKVNFTMTGEWRLDFELHKGTFLLGSRFFEVIVR